MAWMETDSMEAIKWRLKHLSALGFLVRRPCYRFSYFSPGIDPTDKHTHPMCGFYEASCVVSGRTRCFFADNRNLKQTKTATPTSVFLRNPRTVFY